MALQRAGSQDGLTALAGGGQTGATELRDMAFNRVATVATAADSVMLPTGIAGKWLDGVNTSANSMNLFPKPAETINSLSANTALAIAAGKAFHAFCPADGKWYVVLSA